jgi:FlaA1/EpsC-like NDP-sugar epimerase
MDATLKKSHFNVRNRYLLLADLILIVISVLVSFALKLELDNLYPYYRAIFVMAVISLAVKPVIYYSFGLYRRLWVYASVNELKIIVAAVSVASVIVSAIMILLFILGVFTGLPRSVLGIDFLLSLIFVGGVRFALRLRAESRAPQPKNGKTRKVLVIGAGDAGALVVRELQKNRQLNLEPVGFLDDDPGKQQHEIYGVQVIGSLNDLHGILEKDHVDEVIIAIPTAPGNVVRRVADVCRINGIPFRTMPGIFELIGGKVSVSRLREVDITDLLRREPARIHEEWIGDVLKGKCILVTGAGGSIGRELCRQITRWGPKRLITLGHGENSIFEALLELAENNPFLDVVPIIADVRDKQRIEAVLAQYHPQVIFHTAAHKHVPLMQVNTEEAVSNNVLGTHNLVSAAIESGVDRFVLISTDKAVRPVNVYGATKRLAEMIVLDAAQKTGKSYSVVRFGNVLGSRGSVVPIFKRQIAQGGPITLTHPDMERYFMTIPEAVHLVLQAAAMGKGGEAFLLNMGQQIRILDLAEDLIRLSGLEPGRDIEIVFTGIRPGEKLREDLWESDKTYEETAHPEIFRSTQETIPSTESLSELINKLGKSIMSNHPEEIIQLLDESIPGAAIKETPPLPDLTSVI